MAHRLGETDDLLLLTGIGFFVMFSIVVRKYTNNFRISKKISNLFMAL